MVTVEKLDRFGGWKKMFFYFIVTLFAFPVHADIFPAVGELPVHAGLPDPFLKVDGTRVTTKTEWKQQREYLKRMLEHYQYGHLPPAPEKVRWVTDSKTTYFDGKAEQRLGRVVVEHQGEVLEIRAGLIRPVGTGPFPVIIKNANYLFDYDLIDDPKRIQKYAKQQRLKVESDAFRAAVQRGYAIVKFYREDVLPDRTSSGQETFLKMFPDFDGGCIAAWAWGTSRLVDIVLTKSWCKPDAITVTGHSRGGKTALCAGIYDERITLTAPNSSGAGGTASWLHFEKNQPRQTIAVHAANHAYWWNPRLFDFVGKEKHLPFDAHTAKLLIAPRALLNTHATEDFWANPYGTAITFEAAQKVFDWLNVAENQGIHWRTGEHQQDFEDWLALLDFADQLFFDRPSNREFSDTKHEVPPQLIPWQIPAR